MYTLGINAVYHHPAACLVKDGQVVAAAEEERFTHIKLVDVEHTYALATPTVTVFGGGSPLLNGPLQAGPFRVLAHEVPCRPCGYQTCPIGSVCLDGVKVEHAVEVASAIMRTQ